MSCGHRRHSIQCIVPPHILEQIILNGDTADRAWAIAAMGVDVEVRSAHVTEQALRAALPPVERAGVAAHKQRIIYHAHDTQTLPGSVVRNEGQGPTGDAAVDEAYDGLGTTFDLYFSQYQRNSIDDAGMNLVGTVHYGVNVANAYWNGQQMIFGDGDGKYFQRFTIAVDVMGHEMTHGVTAHEANLAYKDQPGALNESVSDVFGSLVKQLKLQQTAAQADWLIGAGLFTPAVKGVALRSMKAPGTAYNDPVLGKDPQPADMAHYVKTTADNGGVHINSGIPNRAFYLTAIALGGYAWLKAGKIWYATLCDPRLKADAQFVDFATLTADNAGKLFGDVEKQAVIDAWNQVGIALAPVTRAEKISGNWVLHYSWGPTNAYTQSSIVFNPNGTFGGAAIGKWQQQDGTLLLSFDTGPAKYGGTVDANIGSGAMSTFAGLNGCWYLTKQGTTGIFAEMAPAAQSGHDAAGNPLGRMEVARQPAFDAAGNFSRRPV